MTLNPSEAQLRIREYPMFCLWPFATDTLFLPSGVAEDEDNKKYDLTSKVYVLMKRLGQSYTEIMRMDAEERDKYFEIELKLMKKEAEDAEKNKGN